jgi:uncharacterized membrane protein
MSLFIMTCVTCGALVGMLTLSVFLITLATALTLTSLWASGAMTSGQFGLWLITGAIAQQLAFLLIIFARYWAAEPRRREQAAGASDKPEPAPGKASLETRTIAPSL